MFLDGLKMKIVSQLGAPALVFSYPPSSALGDISLACFGPAKEMGLSPVELAKEWAEELRQDKSLAGFFSAIETAGPYLNFFIAPALLAAEVIGQIKKEKENYGRNGQGRGQQVMIEYSNGNTHKDAA